MKKKRKQYYFQPAMNVVELDLFQPLLANTGGANLGGYGDAIDEGDTGGWQTTP